MFFTKLANAVTSEPEVESNSDMTVYPNPANNFITINNLQTAFKGIQIYNMLGECVIDFQPEKKNKAQIDISSLSPGVYFLKALAGTNIYSQKIIVE